MNTSVGAPPLLQRLRSLSFSKADDKRLTIAINFDNTLVSVLRDACGNVIHKQADDTIPVFNPHYNVQLQFRLAHGAEEFIKALTSLPNIRLCFFSAGKQWRNEELAKQLMRRVDTRFAKKSVVPSITGTPYRVISAPLGVKDLRTLTKEGDLDYTILVDHSTPVPLEQVHNVLKIQGLHAPAGHGVFRNGKNDLMYALGLILEAIDVVKARGMSFKAAVRMLQAAEEGRAGGEAAAGLVVGSAPAQLEGILQSAAETSVDKQRDPANNHEVVRRFFERGLAEMKKYNPDIAFRH